MSDQKLRRIAIVSADKCKPKKCGLQCKKSCPVVKTGKFCIEVTPTTKIASISEELCIGCGICVKKCPFDAIQIINLPKNLDKDTTYRYGPNSFKLHRLPVPRPGQVLGLVGTNGMGKTTALKILAGTLKPNLGNFENPPNWQGILTYFRGSELQNYFTHMLEDNLKKELIDPAVEGTMNVLKSCKKVSTIKRVVVTSSMATMTHNNNPLTHGVVMDETWHSDLALCKKKKEWYAISKTLAEEATWKFAEENGLDFVTLHPGFVIGPPLQSVLGMTCGAFLDLIKEGKELLPSGVYRYVDVRDVALAHILALENPSARGRYCLVGSVASSSKVFDILKHVFPSFNLPPTKTEKQAGNPHYKVSQERAKNLGINFMPLELTIKDTVERFRNNNFITF